jgi:alpha-1,2-glucosyltransferase
MENRIAHPFILADNRHYIFYLWKNFYGRFEWFRYVMCPVYAAAVLYLIPILMSKLNMHVKLLASQEKFIMLFFWVTLSTMALMPSPLIEFRYFILPWMFLQFEIAPFIADEREEKYKIKNDFSAFLASLWPNILFSILVNVVTLYVFLNKPFVYNATTGEIGRFMW